MMTQRPTDRLITALTADLKPVRPLMPPVFRATLVLACMGAVAAVAIVAAPDAPVAATGIARVGRFPIDSSAAVATGVLAIAAAFMLSVPGRSRGWLLAPLPPFAIWLFASGWGCFIAVSPDGTGAPPALRCFTFILGASIILAPPLIWSLARARPIDPVGVGAMAGLAVAAFAAAMLVFVHPHRVTALDLAAHFSGMALVIGAGLAFRRRLFAGA